MKRVVSKLERIVYFVSKEEMINCLINGEKPIWQDLSGGPGKILLPNPKSVETKADGSVVITYEYEDKPLI